MNILINNTSQKEELRQAIFLFVIWCLVPLFFPFLLLLLGVKLYLIAGNVTNTCFTNFSDTLSGIRKSESVSEAKS